MNDVVMHCIACNKVQGTGKFCQDCGKSLSKKDYAALEEEFATLVRHVSAKVREASNIMKDAQEMANELGIPFDKGDAVYIPEAFYSKFANIRHITVEKLVHGVYASDLENETIGWITSSQRC